MTLAVQVLILTGIGDTTLEVSICQASAVKLFSSLFGLESGVSDNPCDQTFNGPNAFSEAESETVRQFWETEFQGDANLLPKLSICFHSYSQLVRI